VRIAHGEQPAGDSHAVVHGYNAQSGACEGEMECNNSKGAQAPQAQAAQRTCAHADAAVVQVAAGDLPGKRTCKSGCAACGTDDVLTMGGMLSTAVGDAGARPMEPMCMLIGIYSGR
jgi:hypothetical protein